MSDVPRLPRLPDPGDNEGPPSAEARNAATLLAVILLSGVGLGLVFLVVLVLGPGALFVMLAFALIPLYFVFHYLVWGRLMRTTRDDEDEAGDRSLSGAHEPRDWD